MGTIDLIKLKDEVVVSKKDLRVSEYLGEVLLKLVTRGVKKDAVFADKDEHISEVILIVMEKMKRYMREKGKLIVKGYDPKQVLKYLIGMVNFSIMEHKSFIFDKYKRQLRGTEPTFISLEALADFGEEPSFDIEIDYYDEISVEERFIEDLYND